MELKKSIMRSIIKQKREFFNPLSPTAHDDIFVISQLEMETLCLSMAVKAKRQKYDLPPNEEEDLVKEDEESLSEAENNKESSSQYP